MNMMKIAGAVALMSFAMHAPAQELFVYTEPASNMPAKTVGVRATNWLMQDKIAGGINYHFIPELMIGINKKLMVHAEFFASNRQAQFSGEGGAVYAKYRFLSHDKKYRHFRMATFARLASNNGDVHQEELETNGHNSGAEFGLIATQLLHKQAVSATVSGEAVWNNSGGNDFPAGQANRAVNYTLSTGRLLFPRTYKSYKATNLNVMLEAIGQWHPQTGKSFLDVAAAVQLIFNSQTRLDIAYKKQVYADMLRSAPDGLLLRLEHLFFSFKRA